MVNQPEFCPYPHDEPRRSHPDATDGACATHLAEQEERAAERKAKRKRTINVFGAVIQGHDGRQYRGVVAATSRTAACKLMGVRPDYCGETGNAEERLAALAEPGVIFARKAHDWTGPYRRFNRERATLE